MSRGRRRGSGRAAAAAGKFDYVGSAKCGMCTRATPRATSSSVAGKPASKAYATLQGEKAKQIATEKKLAKPAHEAPECLSAMPPRP